MYKREHCLRCASEVLAVTLGGLDALVFTAGIGANSPEVRTRICAHLTDVFGVALDPHANSENCQRVSRDSSRVPVLVLPTDEEGMIALSTARILRHIKIRIAEEIQIPCRVKRDHRNNCDATKGVDNRPALASKRRCHNRLRRLIY